jgi:uncharacterized membrane protein
MTITNSMDVRRPDRAADRRELIGAAVLGIALGGFFDGILLHQVLQWHHLLSLVVGDSLRDMRSQIMADGLFHVLMYVVAAIGLWLIWSAAGSSAFGRSDRRLLASALLGFGAWQFADVIVFHWIARIHRIRVDVPNPLAWDIGWMIVFGVPTVALGLWLLARSRQEPPRETRSAAGRAALTGIVLAAGPLGFLQPANAATLVLFQSGMSPAQTFAAVAAADARIVWAHESGGLIAVLPGSDFSRIKLVRSGAIFVGTGWIAGCTSYFRI